MVVVPVLHSTLISERVVELDSVCGLLTRLFLDTNRIDPIKSSYCKQPASHWLGIDENNNIF